MTNLDILKESMLLISKLPLSTLKEIGGYLIGWVGAIITQKVLLQGKNAVNLVDMTIHDQINCTKHWHMMTMVKFKSYYSNFMTLSSICWLRTLCFYLDDLDIPLFYFLCLDNDSLIVNLTFCCFALVYWERIKKWHLCICHFLLLMLSF